MDGPDLMFYTNPIQIMTYGMAPSDLAPNGVVLAGHQPQLASDASLYGRPRIPSFVLLAFVGCGGLLVALIDRWRIEAARRFAEQFLQRRARRRRADDLLRQGAVVLQEPVGHAPAVLVQGGGVGVRKRFCQGAAQVV